MDDVRQLTTENCYIGQRVFIIRWLEPEELYKSENGEPYTGWVGYAPGRTPEIWWDVVVKLPKNGIIRGEMYNKLDIAFSCELHAVHWAYQWFCDYRLTEHSAWYSVKKTFKRLPIEEAVRVLRSLAELETGCHARHSAAQRMQAEQEHTEA